MWVLLGNASRPPRAKGELPSLLLRLSNFLGYFFLILVNILSSTGALGKTNAEVSAKYPTPLTPSGWAFAIWGLIFALQGLGVAYQIINSGYRENGWKADVVNKIGYGWQLGWLFQDLWQFAFVRQSVPGMWLAAAALLAALASFQYTLQRLNGTTHELRARGYAAMPAAAYVCFKLPTSVNAAWLSVATALGLLIVPVSYGVPQARLVAPAAVLAVAVTAGGVWRLVSHRDVGYGFTLIWALSAVASNNSDNVPTAVKVVGIVCLVVLALFIVSALVRTRREMATAAAGVDGSLLYDTYSAYGSSSSYGSQRMPLSDASDAAPAGYERATYSSGGGGAAGFTFSTVPNSSNGNTVASGGFNGPEASDAIGSGDSRILPPFSPSTGLGSSPGAGNSAAAAATKAAVQSGIRTLSPGGAIQNGVGGAGSEGPRVSGTGTRQQGEVSPRGTVVMAGGGRRVRFSDEEAAIGSR